MGYSGTALSDDGGAAVLNPAGLTLLESDFIQFSQTEQTGGGEQILVSWAGPVTDGLAHSQNFWKQGDDLSEELRFQSSFGLDLGVLSPYFSGSRMGISGQMYFMQVGKSGEGVDRSTGYGSGWGIDFGLQW
jgi:hypothetical protein